MRGHQIISFQPQRALERTHDGVIVQQIAQRFIVKEIVNGNHFDVSTLIQNTEDCAANSAKSVDCNSHFAPPMEPSLL